MSIYSKTTNPFSIEREIRAAREIAERNGFSLEEHHHYPDRITITTKKFPYAEGVAIRGFNSWNEVVIYFMGYEQRIIEMQFKGTK